MSRTRVALGDLVVQDSFGRPRLIHSEATEPYLLLAAGRARESWCKAVDLYTDLEADETMFWVDFRMKVQQALAAGVQAATVIPMKPRHRAVLEPLLMKNAEEITRKLESGELLPNKLAPSVAKAPVARFPAMDGLRWKEVTITFISDFSVRISARGRLVKFTFQQMGFEDRRKGDMPDTRWAFLRQLAKLKGQLSRRSKVDQLTKNRAKSAVMQIRDRLQLVLHIPDDPFENYRRVGAYKTKFTLLDDSSEQRRSPNDSAPDASA